MTRETDSTHKRQCQPRPASQTGHPTDYRRVLGRRHVPAYISSLIFHPLLVCILITTFIVTIDSLKILPIDSPHDELPLYKRWRYLSKRVGNRQKGQRTTQAADQDHLWNSGRRLSLHLQGEESLLGMGCSKGITDSTIDISTVYRNLPPIDPCPFHHP